MIKLYRIVYIIVIMHDSKLYLLREGKKMFLFRFYFVFPSFLSLLMVHLITFICTYSHLCYAFSVHIYIVSLYIQLNAFVAKDSSSDNNRTKNTHSNKMYVEVSVFSTSPIMFFCKQRSLEDKLLSGWPRG